MRLVLSAYGAGTALPRYDHRCRGGHFRFGRRLSALTARPPCAARRAHPAKTAQGALNFNLRLGRTGRGEEKSLGPDCRRPLTHPGFEQASSICRSERHRFWWRAPFVKGRADRRGDRRGRSWGPKFAQQTWGAQPAQRDVPLLDRMSNRAGPVPWRQDGARTVSRRNQTAHKRPSINPHPRKPRKQQRPANGRRPFLNAPSPVGTTPAVAAAPPGNRGAFLLPQLQAARGSSTKKAPRGAFDVHASVLQPSQGSTS